MNPKHYVPQLPGTISSVIAAPPRTCLRSTIVTLRPAFAKYAPYNHIPTYAVHILSILHTATMPLCPPPTINTSALSGGGCCFASIANEDVHRTVLRAERIFEIL
jgi:hypothetical protein